MPRDLNYPWLVAVWPGMGKVALGAGSYLVDKLNAKPMGDLKASEYFDVDKIEFKRGVICTVKMPRNRFFLWRNPSGGNDLVIFVGDAQPNGRGWELCHALLDEAEKMGVRRVFTFAAMATMTAPTPQPRVFVVVNRKSVLREFVDGRVEVLAEGQISGLNGVLLAAADERGIDGVCLLGELPYVGIVVPNPRASGAVLEVFAESLGVDLDMTDLEFEAQAVDQGLTELMRQMARTQDKRTVMKTGKKSGSDEATDGSGRASDSSEDEPDAHGMLSADRRRIEELFLKASDDREAALELKRQLDRLGVFKEFEDRFLDLFKSG